MDSSIKNHHPFANVIKKVEMEKGAFDSFYFFLRVLNQSTQIYISDHNKLYKMFICSSILIWSIYISVDTIFQSSWFISGFPLLEGCF